MANKTQSKTAKPSKTGAPDAIELLKADHRKVEGLFDDYEKESSSAKKTKLAKEICNELIIHTTIEEEIFYPACRALIDDDDLLDEAQVEHDSAKELIIELRAGSPGDEFYDAKVKVLSEQIKHHVKEEEKRGEGIFAEARAAGLDTEALGGQMKARKAELKKEADSGGLPKPEPKSYRAQNGKPEKSLANAKTTASPAPKRGNGGTSKGDETRATRTGRNAS